MQKQKTTFLFFIRQAREKTDATGIALREAAGEKTSLSPPAATRPSRLFGGSGKFAPRLSKSGIIGKTKRQAILNDCGDPASAARSPKSDREKETPMRDPLEAMPDPDTICAHWGEDRTHYQGAVIPPIYQNSLFTFPDCETRETNYAAGEGDFDAGHVSNRYEYSRVCNPTTDIAEAKIAALEGAEAARCFGSGMGAISAAILSAIKAGDHVVTLNSVYGPTRQFLLNYLPRFGITTTLIDGSEVGEWADAIRPETALFCLESPSSIVMTQQDMTAVAQIAKERGITTLCDNSWASPIFQNPGKMGVDLTIHSATKYLGGHSDIVAGVVAGSAARIRKMTLDEGCLLGAVIDPFSAWLLIRGIRTLGVRMERHQRTARRIGTQLLEHPAVANVFYPGLPNDPQPELTAKQLRGTSGLLSVELKTPTKEANYRFINGLKYFGIGCSWGGFESLAMPASLPARTLNRTGEPVWLTRLHLGLESESDLWDDLSAALK